MGHHTYAPPREELHDALREIFRTLKPHSQPLSVRMTVERLREMANTDGLTFRNLADVVADYAVRRGLDLHFDANEPDETAAIRRPSVSATRTPDGSTTEPKPRRALP